MCIQAHFPMISILLHYHFIGSGTFSSGNYLIICNLLIFFSEVKILLQTKAQNVDWFDSTYRPGKCHFQLSEGSQFFKIFCTRQPMVALHLVFWAGLQNSGRESSAPPPNWKAPVCLRKQAQFLPEKYNQKLPCALNMFISYVHII